MGSMSTIETAAGRARAYEAGDAASGHAGVVVFHAWWGLNDDVRAYADRLAAAGFAVVAPDLYAGALATTVAEAERLRDSMDEAAADAIALAAVDRLAAAVGPNARLGTVGFSLGAAWALWVAAERRSVAASVAYYGTLGGGALSRASAAVLGHFAEADEFEPDEGIVAFEAALREAGRDVEIRRYPGTGHWFAEPSRDAYRAPDAELAFERTVAFLRDRLAR